MDAAGTRAYYATVAPFYDTELAGRDDLRCWLSLAEAWKPERTVDCGCGTGRVAIPLALRCAEWGGQVVGLDLSPAMLRRARQRWEASGVDAPPSALRLRAEDMRHMSLGQPVDLAIFADDPLTHLTEWRDLTSTFKGVKDHLRPGGRLVVEASLLPPEAVGKRYPVFTRSQFRAGSPEGVLDIEQERRVDPRGGWAEVTYRYRLRETAKGDEQAVTEAHFVAHYLDLPTLEALFRQAGCRLEERWGDFHFRSLAEDSPMMLCTGRKQS